jgi:mRNA interferase RelE/StbE
MSSPRYTVLHSPGAKRAIDHDLPEAVAIAVDGPLAEDPHRVGKPLRFGLEGYWSAGRSQAAERRVRM